MTAKLMTITVFMACTGAMLLLLRQERLHLAHEVTDIYRECQVCKAEIWRMRMRVSELTVPGELQRRIAVSEMELEPNVPRVGEMRGGEWVLAQRSEGLE